MEGKGLMRKLAIKLWNYVLKSRKFEQSCISNQLSVLADISDPVSVIGISAKWTRLLWSRDVSDVKTYLVYLYWLTPSLVVKAFDCRTKVKSHRFESHLFFLQVKCLIFLCMTCCSVTCESVPSFSSPHRWEPRNKSIIRPSNLVWKDREWGGSGTMSRWICG